MFKMQKLLAVYKNKFSQLKSAYDEVEREKENIKVSGETKEGRIPLRFSLLEYSAAASGYIYQALVGPARSDQVGSAS